MGEWSPSPTLWARSLESVSLGETYHHFYHHPLSENSVRLYPGVLTSSQPQCL